MVILTIQVGPWIASFWENHEWSIGRNAGAGSASLASVLRAFAGGAMVC
jgi:hypothetical protein